MASLEGIEEKLKQIISAVRDISELYRAVPGKNVVVVGGLSDIDENLGIVQAGEFRVGKGTPGTDFTGVRMAFPGMTYAGSTWHLVGVNNDNLQFGIRANDGKALFGGGTDVIDENGILITSGGDDRINLQKDGDAFFGSDIDAAATTSLSIFSNAQTYNSESMGDGDLLIGDNSSSKANVLWDRSVGQLLFRGGTTTQGYIDTDGSAVFGAGDVILDSTGLEVNSTGETSSGIGAFRIVNDNLNEHFRMYSFYYSPSNDAVGVLGLKDPSDVYSAALNFIINLDTPTKSVITTRLLATEDNTSDWVEFAMSAYPPSANGLIVYKGVGGYSDNVSMAVNGAAASETLDVYGGIRGRSYIDLAEISAPSTPPSGYGRLYVNTSGVLHYIDDAGNDNPV